MDEFKPQPSSKLNKFISETEIEERKRKRQEEWEKTRRDDQPLECPEEVYDPRSLFERLQENKRKKDDEFEESKKLKHLIRGLDNDELSFLELVDKTKMNEECQRFKEEKETINELKSAITISTEEQDKERERLKKSFAITANAGSSSKKISKANSLGIKRKSTEINHSEKKSHENNDERNEVNNDEPSSKKLRCVGILPGLVSYDSDDSSQSSNSSSDVEIAFKLFPVIRVAPEDR